MHLSDGRTYESKLEQLKQESAKTKEQLVSENMVLAKKLDALEEFRHNDCHEILLLCDTGTFLTNV